MTCDGYLSFVPYEHNHVMQILDYMSPTIYVSTETGQISPLEPSLQISLDFPLFLSYLVFFYFHLHNKACLVPLDREGLSFLDRSLQTKKMDNVYDLDIDCCRKRSCHYDNRPMQYTAILTAERMMIFRCESVIFFLFSLKHTRRL